MLIIEDLNENSKEIWRDVVGYEGLYQVSSIGRVKSLERWSYNGHGYFLKREKFLTPRPNDDGYLTVKLSKHSKEKRCTIHRLVAMAFIANTDNLLEVDHIDASRTNNHVFNLRWVTRKQNMNNLHCTGKNHKWAKKVINIDTQQVFDTVTDAALAFSVTPSAICFAARHNTRCAGYYWQYNL